MQYNFGAMGILMNYTNEEMEANISPTETRFRPDQRLYEEG